jgi:hypothetical protein
MNHGYCSSQYFIGPTAHTLRPEAIRGIASNFVRCRRFAPASAFDCRGWFFQELEKNLPVKSLIFQGLEKNMTIF